MPKKGKEQKSLESFSQCAFCGEKTRYFFPEVNCYICVVCLGKYKKEREANHEITSWRPCPPWIWRGNWCSWDNSGTTL